MVDLKKIKRSICQIGKHLFEKELTDSAGGNISIRHENKIYISPRRAGADHQWLIDEDSIIVTDICKIPILGKSEEISREAYAHYNIYQNFPDVNGIIHAHPFFIGVFGSAHMDLEVLTVPSRNILGDQPIQVIKESLPGSVILAKRVISNFKHRRKIDSNAALICIIPFHGIFAAANDLNKAFLYVDIANINAKTLIYREIMFGNDKNKKFSVFERYSKDDILSIEKVKDVSKSGYSYQDAFGNKTTYLGNDQDIYKKTRK